MRFNPNARLDPSQVSDYRGFPLREPLSSSRERYMPSRRIADMRQLSPPTRPAHGLIRQLAANPYPNSTPHLANHHFHIPLPNFFPDPTPAHLPMAPPTSHTTYINIDPRVNPHVRAMAQWLNLHHPRR